MSVSPAPPVPTRTSARAQRKRVAPIAWEPFEGIDRDTWRSTGVRLGGWSRSSNWWVGDWLRYGTEKWGEKYVTAAKITGYDTHSLENMVYVASRFDISLRRENLSWSHHFLVAALEPEEQARWLDLATERRLSVADLRIELRSARRGPKQMDDSDDDSTSAAAEVDGIPCPNCGHIVPMSPSSEVVGPGLATDIPEDPAERPQLPVAV
jgi:hypothetical protein